MRPLRRLICLLALPIATVAAQPRGIPDGWSDGYVYANGIRIHFYQATPVPEKPAIVMVHGVTDNGLCWTTLTWKLQDAYNIYMLDTRGHGLTDPFTASGDTSTLVKDVVAFMEAMKLQRPILMGHSMGAATVMKLGAEHPDLARAIVMLDPSLNPRGPGPRPGAPGAATGAAPAARPRDPLSVSMSGPPEMLVAQNNYSFHDLVAKCRRQSPKWDIVDCQYWALSKKQYHGAYTQEAWEVMSGVMRIGDSLSKITVPALILKADAKQEERAANEEAMRVMKQGTLVHVDGAGHNLHHDELDRTVKEITAFLEKLP